MKFIYCLLILFPVNCLCQTTQILKGKIVCSSSNVPIPYANVCLMNTKQGVSAGVDGTFLFLLPKSDSDSLLITSIGYEPVKIPVANARKMCYLYVMLKPEMYALNEVEIHKPLSAEQILKLAIKKIKSNYCGTPYLLSGYFRECQQKDGRWVRFFESAVDVWDDGKISQPLSEHPVRINVARLCQSKGYDAYQYIWLNALWWHIKLCWGTNTLPEKTSLGAVIDTTFLTADGKVFQISVANEDEKLTYLINASDYSFRKVSWYYKEKTLGITKYGHKNGDKSVFGAIPEESYTIVFDKTYGRYLPNYIYFVCRYEFYSDEVGSKKICTLTQIVDFTLQSAKESSDGIPISERYTDDIDVSRTEYPSNPEFWIKYPFAVYDSLRHAVQKELPDVP